MTLHLMPILLAKAMLLELLCFRSGGVWILKLKIMLSICCIWMTDQFCLRTSPSSLYRGKVGLDVAEAQHLFDGLDWQGAVKDIHASVNWLKANGSKKAGVTGFCMGGALAIASSVVVPNVDAVVAFYGVPSSELADPAQAKAPIQAHFGELDDFVGFSDVTAAKALEERLKASGVPHEVHIYPGNRHAFMNRSPEGIKRRKSMGMPDEDEAAVQLAWSRFKSWMTHYLTV
ncbi:uncharacterized protein LOC113858254 isoform X2 [Abrus precatorius]|uniref:Uncharacterized protein LOC113858254 isoform X2 n=1 Tax=Abrus precatorius TaxID=3816 RepID=A0A8B8KRU8_ABRPR|nr:uncharacterized protein LOC113858254 isoform X2 [Abrus precatorius]